MALESNDTNPRVKPRPQRNRLNQIKDIRLDTELSRKEGTRKVKLKKLMPKTSRKSMLKRAMCEEKDLKEHQEDEVRASMVHTRVRSNISNNTMAKKLHMVLRSTHTKKAANTKKLVDSNTMTNTTTRSIIRKLLRSTLRKVKGSIESVHLRGVHNMR